jgi:PAS domain S-box-containing protein
MVEAQKAINVQFYDHLMQSMPEGLLIVDERDAIISANHMAALMLGSDSEALIGRHSHEFWPEGLPSLDRQDLSAIVYHETTIHRDNGRFLPVSLTITPIAAQSANSRLVAISPLADVQQINESLSHTQRLAGIGVLTASVAHELNSPISIITATCNNLIHSVEGKNLNPEQLLRYVQMIEQNAWRCARIVGVLRNYSHDDESQMAVTDLNMIIEDALTLVWHQFRGDFNVQIETDLAPDLKSIVCDHHRITQVLINLLTNARDAMQPGGGTVHIKSWLIPAESGFPPWATAETTGAMATRELLAFSIQDSGHGIKPEIMNKIFNPFFTTKPNGMGTGLGLFIAKRIVLQHNGRIWAENNADGGATFTVVLPQR